MAQSSQSDDISLLNSQIREAYGKVLYTQVCHEKITERLTFRDTAIKIIQIILSALTTGGFIAAVAMPEKNTSILGIVVSTLLLILNSYAKGFGLAEKSQEHRIAAIKLWRIREKYISLLVDFNNLGYDKIISFRDSLQNETFQIYSETPRTDKKSYKEAQKALKIEEEQSFSESEIDALLPESLRRN